MTGAKISVTRDNFVSSPVDIVRLCLKEPSSKYCVLISLGKTTVPLTRYVGCAIHVMV